MGLVHGIGKAKKQGSALERWIELVIEQFRAGVLEAMEGSAIYTIATHRDKDGQLLDTHTAAVELINILRPIVAVARFIVYGALALYDYPDCKKNFMEGNDRYVEIFVQEVRRYYPFAPFLGAMVRQDFEWKGFRFKKGTSVLIDLYGTNHDPALWEMPHEFRPERFEERESNLYDFVPQGGGNPHTGHRCPGEEATLRIMNKSLKFLMNELTYDVQKGQDLSISNIRIPTFPKSRFVIQNITKKSSSMRAP